MDVVDPSTVAVLTADTGLADALVRLLGLHGFDVRSVAPPAEADVGAVRAVAGRLPGPGDAPCAVLVDARLLLPDPDARLPHLASAFPGARLVVMAADQWHPGLAGAVDAGAVGLTADFDPGELVAMLRGSGGSGSGPAGVREPRRPGPPTGTSGRALRLPGG